MAWDTNPSGSSLGFNKSAGTTLVHSPGGTLNAGGTIVVVVVADDITTGDAIPTNAVTDSAGNTYTRVASNQGASNAAGVAVAVFASTLTADLTGGTITFTPNALVAAKGGYWRFFDSGGSTTVRPTTQETANGTSGTPTATHTGPVDGDLVIGVVAAEGPTGDAFTADADTTNGAWSTVDRGGTSGGSATTNVHVGMQRKIVTATGSQTYNPTITSRDWREIIVVLEPGGSAFTKEQTNALGMTDSEFESMSVLARAPAEALSLLDATAQVGTYPRDVTDPIGALDSIVVETVIGGAATDPIGALDDASGTSTAARVATDTAALTDPREQTTVLDRSRTDLFGALDDQSVVLDARPQVVDAQHVMSQGGDVVIDPQGHVHMSDDFTTQRTEWWGSYGDAAWTSGEARLYINASGSGIFLPTLTANDDFRELAFTLKAVETAGPVDWFEWWIELKSPPIAAFRRYHEEGVEDTLFVLTSEVQRTSVPYDPVAHRWLRLRDEGGTFFMESSPDAATWSVLWSEPTPAGLDHCFLDIYAWTTVLAQGVLTNWLAIDDFSITRPAPEIDGDGNIVTGPGETRLLVEEVRGRDATDAAGLVDEPSPFVESSRSTLDVLGVLDLVVQQAQLDRAVDVESMALADTSESVTSTQRDATDQLDALDEIGFRADFAAQLTSDVELVDTTEEDHTQPLSGERSVTSQLGLDDDTSQTVELYRSDDETLEASESAEVVVSLPRQLDSVLGTSDNAESILAQSRAQSDDLTMSDPSARTVATALVVADVLGLLDSIAVEHVLGVLNRSVDDGLGASDTVTRTSDAHRSIVDLVGLVDVVSRVAAYTRSASDVEPMSDTAVETVAELLEREIVDVLDGSDSAGVTLLVELADSLDAADLVLTAQPFVAALDDVLGLDDDQRRDMTRELIELLGASDFVNLSGSAVLVRIVQWAVGHVRTRWDVGDVELRWAVAEAVSRWAHEQAVTRWQTGAIRESTGLGVLRSEP